MPTVLRDCSSGSRGPLWCHQASFKDLQVQCPAPQVSLKVTPTQGPVPWEAPWTPQPVSSQLRGSSILPSFLQSQSSSPFCHWDVPGSFLWLRPCKIIACRKEFPKRSSCSILSLFFFAPEIGSLLTRPLGLTGTGIQEQSQITFL